MGNPNRCLANYSMLKKKCVYLDLVYNRLLGWEGGSSCVVSGR